MTKFDRLVRDIQDEQAWDEGVSTRQAKREALREARSHVDRMRGRLERATGRGVKVQEISKKGSFDDRGCGVSWLMRA